MAQFRQAQIKQRINEYLEETEQLISIGVFKKVPSISWMLLSRGMAWILASKFYIGVTDRRLIILPESIQKGKSGIFAGFDEVDFYTGLLNNIVLDIHKTYQGEPLKFRFKSGYAFEGMDQFDFIAAVKQGKRAIAGKV